MCVGTGLPGDEAIRTGARAAPTVGDWRSRSRAISGAATAAAGGDACKAARSGGGGAANGDSCAPKLGMLDGAGQLGSGMRRRDDRRQQAAAGGGSLSAGAAGSCCVRPPPRALSAWLVVACLRCQRPPIRRSRKLGASAAASSLGRPTCAAQPRLEDPWSSQGRGRLL